MVNSHQQSSHQRQLDQLLQQYEQFPYPYQPIEANPEKDDRNLDLFFIHSVATPYYLRNQRVPDSSNLTILDAGCGSGYQALRLAQANPGARVVGVDLSPESVKMAERRLQFHGYDQAEFHAMLLEDLPSLRMTFDYINCDEVLYLLPDPEAGLKALKAVLKPGGILRTNFHSALGRRVFYRAQTLSRLIGLMEGNPGEAEVKQVRDMMSSLKTDVRIKKETWGANFEDESPKGDEFVLMNHLLQGDKGFTIPDTFGLLRAHELDFISMVFWRDWEVLTLFKDPDDLPAVWAFALPELTDEERLRIYELINPVHRLIDFWCGHAEQAQSFQPLAEWEVSDWLQATIHVHPLLQRPEIEQAVITCIRERRPFDFSRYISLPTMTPISISSEEAAILLPLWTAAQPMRSLIQRYLQIHPLDRATGVPISERAAFEQVQQLISKLEVFLYLMVEQPRA